MSIAEFFLGRNYSAEELAEEINSKKLEGVVAHFERHDDLNNFRLRTDFRFKDWLYFVESRHTKPRNVPEISMDCKVFDGGAEGVVFKIKGIKISYVHYNYGYGLDGEIALIGDKPVTFKPRTSALYQLGEKYFQDARSYLPSEILELARTMPTCGRKLSQY